MFILSLRLQIFLLDPLMLTFRLFKTKMTMFELLKFVHKELTVDQCNEHKLNGI